VTLIEASAEKMFFDKVSIAIDIINFISVNTTILSADKAAI
jgi:hypothetical protein